MSHPILGAALAEDRRRGFLRGAVAQKLHALCRRRQEVTVWRFETAWTRRRAAPNWTRAGTLKARLLARLASLLQIIGKRAES